MPLSVLAQTFARLGTGEGLPADRRKALDRILQACWENPELVAGRGRADTVVMRALPGQVFMKTGAEGVYCGAFPALGLGFALKVDDGGKRAAAGAAMALVERMYPAARGLMPSATSRPGGARGRGRALLGRVRGRPRPSLKDQTATLPASDRCLPRRRPSTRARRRAGAVHGADGAVGGA